MKLADFTTYVLVNILSDTSKIVWRYLKMALDMRYANSFHAHQLKNSFRSCFCMKKIKENDINTQYDWFWSQAWSLQINKLWQDQCQLIQRMCHICCDSIDHIIIESENIITTWVDYACMYFMNSVPSISFFVEICMHICISWYWVPSIPWIWKECVRTIRKLNAHTINQYEIRKNERKIQKGM